MNSLQDALYNWLTIKVVCDARPDDTAAQDTRDFFEEMLTSEHRITNLETSKDEVMYHVVYQQDGETKKTRFPRELIEVMLNQIVKDPERYENYPIEEN